MSISYNQIKEHNTISTTIENFYKEFTETVNTIYENPKASTNFEKANQISKKMVATILSEDFTIGSILTVLSFNYSTHTHSLNTCFYAIILGKQLKLTPNELISLGISALLHDLGKTQINKRIINKNGKLTKQEFEEVQKHSLYGYRLAQQLHIKDEGILLGIRNHHEKIDGTGYPDRLKKDDIHIFARIIGICDIFDALTTKKNYKDVVGTFETLVIMKKEMKGHVDMEIVNSFIRIFHNQG